MADETQNPVAPAPSAAQIDQAKTDVAADNAKQSVAAATALDSGTTGDLVKAARQSRKRVQPHINTTFIAPLLDLGQKAFVEKLTNDKVDGYIQFEEAKALLELERSGKNRTEYVKALMNRIGDDLGEKLESPYEVTSAGPGYTNDTKDLTAL